MSFCLFISLIVASTSFYFYIIVSHYVSSQAYLGHKKFVQHIIGSDQIKSEVNPVAIESRNGLPVLYGNGASSSRVGTESGHTLNDEVRRYKEHLVQKLHRKELDAANVLFRPDRDKNRYKIKFEGKRDSHYPSVSSLCRIKFKTIERTFNGLADLEVLDYLPINTLGEVLDKKVAGERNQRTCALVSSAGALKGSHLGPEIDSHDVVLRFNNAPTKGFEQDVGSKTTVRILNSKVIKSFNISHNLYKQTSVLIGWDPFQYVQPKSDVNSPLQVDHDFSDNFKNSRKVEPNVQFFLMSPDTVWRSWDVLQETTRTSLPKTPPSSGFLGVTFLVNYCSSVTTFEYIPSIRVSSKCHYYDNDTNSMGCTFGDWHPLATEKLFSLRLNYASDFDTVVNGKSLISGCVGKE